MLPCVGKGCAGQQVRGSTYGQDVCWERQQEVRMAQVQVAPEGKRSLSKVRSKRIKQMTVAERKLACSIAPSDKAWTLH